MPSAGEHSENIWTWMRVERLRCLPFVLPWEGIMKLPRRRFLHLAAGAAALPLASSVTKAQAYPTRSITMVVPFAAGGAVDTTARNLAPRLSELLGQQVVVENIGGAGGMTAASRVAKALPDGYQILLGNAGTQDRKSV